MPSKPLNRKCVICGEKFQASDLIEQYNVKGEVSSLP